MPSSLQSNLQIVTEFIRACDGKDMERVLSFFTPDCVYHNIPMEVVRGPEGVRKVLQGFADLSSQWEWEIHHIAESANGVVLTERTDRIGVAGEWFEFPCMGVFELRQGKIHAWRDYFDLQQVMQAAQAAAQRKAKSG